MSIDDDPVASALAAELAVMNCRRQVRARACGIDEEAEAADDADDIKAAVISLIVGEEPVTRLADDLLDCEISELKKRARNSGVDASAIELLTIAMPARRL